jgi:hypothetical protein
MSTVIESVNWYAMLILRDYPDFEDDGLSGGFPDWMYKKWLLGLAGRVHDWNYCTRCHKAGSMTDPKKKWADKALRKHARELLPWYLCLAPIVLYVGVRVGGGFGSWDSCGPEEGDRCRHNIEQPQWMLDND